MLLKSWGAIIHYFQSFALENACLRVYVGVIDDYGQCSMVIEHIAWLLRFGVNRACVSLPLSIFLMYYSSHLNPPQM